MPPHIFCVVVLLLLGGCRSIRGGERPECPSHSEPRALSDAERRDLLAITTSVSDSTANDRETYNFEDYVSRFPAGERVGVVERLRADGYPVATDSAYWHDFDRAILDIRSGTYRYELVDDGSIITSIGGRGDGVETATLRNVVLAERYGVAGVGVAGHLCFAPPGGPTCTVQQAGRAGYNRAMDLTLGRLFGVSDLVRAATEEGIDRYGLCR